MARQIIRFAAWPIFVVGSFFAYAMGFEAWGIATTLVAIPAATVGLLLICEHLSPDRPDGGFWRDPQWKHDAGHGLISQGFGNWLGEVLFISGAVVLAGEIGVHFGGNLWPTTWPFAAQALLGVALADGIDCLLHRVEHRSALLWPIHALHHNTDRLHAMKSGRGHFLGMTARCLVVYAPLAAIGMPATVLAWYAAAVTMFGPIAHSNIDLRLPSFLHSLVLTPHGHRIHHAGDLELAQSNYANVLPVWDIVFGTFRHPDDYPKPDYGTENDPMPTSFIGQTLAPFRAPSVGAGF